MAKHKEPWERQQDEPEKAFAAFKFYRDTPAATRSLAKCSEAYAGSAHSAATERTWTRWSSRWEWQSRIRAWSDELDRVSRLEQFAAIRDMNKRHVGIANLMLSKAAERIQKMAVMDLTPSEARMFFADAAKLERMARGEPDPVAVTSSDITVRVIYGNTNNSHAPGVASKTE